MVYGALYEKPGDLLSSWVDQEQRETNDRMLRNFLDPLTRVAKGLEHFSIMQGGKAYGVGNSSDTGKAYKDILKYPQKERRPRVQHPNFYWLHEDFLKAKQQALAKAGHRGGRSFTYTIWRPPVIIGYAYGSPLNVLAALGAYIAISKELGKPLHYPGGPMKQTEVMDSRLIAKGFEWAATAESAQNKTFNITNGDTLLWDAAFPQLAHHFGSCL